MNCLKFLCTIYDVFSVLLFTFLSPVFSFSASGGTCPDVIKLHYFKYEYPSSPKQFPNLYGHRHFKHLNPKKKHYSGTNHLSVSLILMVLVHSYFRAYFFFQERSMVAASL